VILYYPHNYPCRIRIGIDKKTVEFPTDTFVGHPDDFVFSKTFTKQYEQLKSILEQVGVELCLLGVHKYKGYAHHSTRSSNERTANMLKFVMLAGDPYDPDFVWYRYAGQTAGGEQNRVYVGGKEIHMSTFLAYDPFKRAMLCYPDKKTS
jgi:hypothetical protein